MGDKNGQGIDRKRIIEELAKISNCMDDVYDELRELVKYYEAIILVVDKLPASFEEFEKIAWRKRDMMERYHRILKRIEQADSIIRQLVAYLQPEKNG